MANDKYIDLIASYLSGNISAPEKRELLQWAESDPENQKFFDEMAGLWRITEAYEEGGFETDVPAAWEKLDRRLSPGGSGGPAKIVPLSVRSVFLRVAAATVLLVAASYGIFSVWTNFNRPAPNPMAVISTLDDESRELTLPDGSLVWLNENSQLVYDTTFTVRTVALEGEAFFDVAHREGSPFVIIAGESQTTVLGTAFNVRAYPGEGQVEVTVQRGKVALSKKTDAADQPEVSVTLEAGATGVFDRASDSVSKVEGQLINADAWRTGILNLDGLKMQEVVTTLERYYDVRFEVPNKRILNCRVTNLLFEDRPLDTVLVGLSFIMNLEVERNSDSLIVLKGKRGCPD